MCVLPQNVGLNPTDQRQMQVVKEVTQRVVDARRESALKEVERILIAQKIVKVWKFLRGVKGTSWCEQKTLKTGRRDEALNSQGVDADIWLLCACKKPKQVLSSSFTRISAGVWLQLVGVVDFQTVHVCKKLMVYILSWHIIRGCLYQNRKVSLIDGQGKNFKAMKRLTRSPWWNWV